MKTEELRVKQGRSTELLVRNTRGGLTEGFSVGCKTNNLDIYPHSPMKNETGHATSSNNIAHRSAYYFEIDQSQIP